MILSWCEGSVAGTKKRRGGMLVFQFVYEVGIQETSSAGTLVTENVLEEIKVSSFFGPIFLLFLAIRIILGIVVKP